jgi:hypothetical protein
MNSVLPVDPEEKDQAKAALLKPVILYPGWNDIPDNQWKFCKIHLQSKILGGMVEEIAEKVKTEDGEDYVGRPFVTICKQPSKAIEIVNNCFNVACLQKWLGEIERDEIRVAIKGQIELCESGGVKKE